ncbi:circularly permuted type 2 ATP-grasp protein [Flavobacterium sp. 81]|uniref:circularly permuted type 2 ATP-grasp protein n=1 Tax=Flavobacterium sp. 81 TaxID=2135621 RepID=UPI0011C40B8E|nr:circularly permuted type 2 ATP-grasp protein [Flavobacterium sp. 81]
MIVLAMDMNVTPAIFRAFMMDRIYLPDHLGLRMLGDKRNLSILLELAQNGKFSPDENALILKNIPWTSFIENKKVIFKDSEYILQELLKTDKDKFVIKVARGFQGKDVFIGKFSTDKEWEEALELALKNSAFIAQEFSDSLDFLAPNTENEWTLHKLIWGSFGFGDSYGGVWVRMSEVKTDVGVINSATGAVEAIVFEIVN